MTSSPFLLPLPEPTLRRMVRLIFKPISRGQSLVLLFDQIKAGRRALPKFIISSLDLFADELDNKPDHYRFCFIDPVEITEESDLGYLQLFHQTLSPDLRSPPKTYYETYSRLKNTLARKVKKNDIVFFLHQFDELPYMSRRLANNLKALWQIDKERIHFVFLPFAPFNPDFLTDRYGELTEVLTQNTVSLPPLSPQDEDYVLDRYSHAFRCRLSLAEKKAAKKIAARNPNLLKTACHLLSLSGRRGDPYSYLSRHPQIRSLKTEESGITGRLDLDPPTGNFTLDGRPVEIGLTGKEYDLLAAFLKNTSQLISREKIADILWGKDSFEKYSDWAIDQLIYSLRNKLAAIHKDHLLKTIRGQGYKFTQY